MEADNGPTNVAALPAAGKYMLNQNRKKEKQRKIIPFDWSVIFVKGGRRVLCSYINSAHLARKLRNCWCRRKFFFFLFRVLVDQFFNVSATCFSQQIFVWTIYVSMAHECILVVYVYASYIDYYVVCECGVTARRGMSNCTNVQCMCVISYCIRVGNTQQRATLSVEAPEQIPLTHTHNSNSSSSSLLGIPNMLLHLLCSM